MPQQVAYYRRPLSLRLLLLVNVITLLLSIVVLVEGIWMRHRHHDDCSSRLQWFVISIGIIMFFLSFLGWLAASRQKVGLLWLYLAFLTILIVLLIIFTIFAFVLKNHGFVSLVDMPSSLVSHYDCDPGFLFAFKQDWGTLATTSLIVLILLLFLYSIACSAFMHALHNQILHPGFA